MNLIYKCIPRYIATLGYYQKKYSLGQREGYNKGVLYSLGQREGYNKGVLYSLGQREGYNKGVLYLISVLSMTHRYIISLHGHYVI
jgi:hypothetical protein